MQPSILRTAKALLVPVLAVGLFACPPLPNPLTDNFDDTITWQTGGCGDVRIFGDDGADTVAFFFDSEGQAAAANQAGSEQTFTLTLGDDAKFVIQQGERLTIDTCDDVIEVGNEAYVAREYTAVSGTATLTVKPSADQYGSNEATLTIQNAVLEADEVEDLKVDAMGPFTVQVGWLPG